MKRPQKKAHRRLPAKLKAQALVQVDAALAHADVASHIGLGLLDKVRDGHIATRLVLGALKSVPDADWQITPASKAQHQIARGAQILAISCHGDLYVIDQAPPTADGPLQCRVFSAPRQPSGQIVGTWEQFKAELSLLELVVCLRKSSPRPPRALDDFVIAHFWGFRKLGLQIIATALFVSLLGVATPVAFQTFTDKILPHRAQASLQVLAVVLSITLVATSVMECLHDYLQSVALARFRSRLGHEMLSRLLHMEVPYFDERPVGDLTKLTAQVTEVSQFLIKQLSDVVIAIFSLLVITPLLLFYSVPLTGVVVGAGVLMAATTALALGAFQRRVAQAYVLDADFQSAVIEMLKGIRTIKSLALERVFIQRTSSRMENQLFGGFELERLGHIVRSIVNFQGRFIAVLVMLIGASAVFRDELSIGQLIAVQMLAGHLVQPLVSLVFAVHGWQSYRLAHAKLLELQPREQPAQDTGVAGADLDGDIVFEHVWFKYPGASSWALQDLDLVVRRGVMAGVVGQSGSGKSTLIALLQGLYEPTQGRILINGVDLRDIPRDALRKNLAVVSQSCFLFNQSIFENVRLGRLNSEFPDIKRAMDESQSMEFIEKMPGRWSAKLAEDGSNLSGGQRQRLAIARALVRNAPVLLFDEATSALDHETEALVRAAIRNACEGKTALLIAHQVQSLADCGEIILLSHGRVVAHGSPGAVAAADPNFDKVWCSSNQGDSVLAAGINHHALHVERDSYAHAPE